MSSPACQRARPSYVEISKFLRAPRSYARVPIMLRGQNYRWLNISCSVRQEDAKFGGGTAFLEEYKSSLTFSQQTSDVHRLKFLYNSKSPEREVVVHGYLGSRHDLSRNLSFVPIRDKQYICEVQIVSAIDPKSEKSHTAHEKLRSLRPHTPVAVRGLLGRKASRKAVPVREDGHLGDDPAADKTMLSDLVDLEIKLHDIQSLNDFPSSIIVNADTNFPPEQRHLQIRNDENLLRALVLRSSTAKAIRNELEKQSFLEVETPVLFKSTSEGAREFIVPTRRKNLAYALPQSPQQFKQILMASGVAKYYQFAKCFRDEDLRADRQPEFTQLDLEMAFAKGDNVTTLVEQLIRRVWKVKLSTELPDPFPQLTYEQAMSKYGSDKPDLRIPIHPFTRVDVILPADLMSKITPLKDPLVEAMVVPLKTSPYKARDFISAFLDCAQNRVFLDNPDGGPGVFIYDSGKPLQGLSAFGFEAVEQIEREIELEDGFLIILQARKKGPLSGGFTPLGNLRTAIHSAAVSQLYLRPNAWDDFRPLWVTDFPLFKPPESSEPGQGGNAGLASTHHPFTSPKTAADVDLLLTDPTKATGDHYDLVMNGEEIGGGSRRIHHAAMQEFVFRDILKMDGERIAEFSHLLDALRAGCPPHAGIALGFDRLVAIIHSAKLGLKRSLRDVIAFPKSGRGEDMMMKSPSPVSEDVLKTYHLMFRD